MKKRRASWDVQSDKRKERLDDRRVEFAQTLRALNSQFCEWVQEQNRDKPAELWSEGVEDYLTHAKELLSEFSDVIDEEEEGKQEDAEEAAGAPVPGTSANGFGSAFGLAPNSQNSGGFGATGGGGGFGFGATASQPAGSSAPAGASQPQQQQSSSVADFLKGIPTPASQALTGSGFGSGKLPPIPAFNFSNGPKSAAASGSGGFDSGLGNGSATGSPGSAPPPAFNFSTAFGGGSSTLPATGLGSTSSPVAASPPASNAFGFGAAVAGTDNSAGPASGASPGSTSSSVFGSKAPLFGTGIGGGGLGSSGFSFGAQMSAASSAAAASSSAAFGLLPATSNTAATSGAPAASSSLFAVTPTQPLPSVFSFASGNAGTVSGTVASAPAQNGADANADADALDENPEDKVKVQLDDSAADILYRDNAKLYFQDKVTKKWEDRGRGNLTLRRAKQQPGDSGPNTPFLVFTMESGRVLLNASLYKGLSMQQQKAMVLMTLEVADAPGGDDDGAAKPAMTLVNFRLRSAEEGKSFHDKIKEHIPS